MYVQCGKDYKLVTEARIEPTQNWDNCKYIIRFYYFSWNDGQLVRHSYMSELFDSELKAEAALSTAIKNNSIYYIRGNS